MATQVIPRVPSTIPTEEFLTQFVRPERPVIVEGLPIAPELAQLAADRDYLKRVEAAAAPKDAHRLSSVWLDVTADTFSKDSPAGRELYSTLCRLVPADVSWRRTHVRLWSSPQGYITAWHYDGNGLSGLNVQVLGRKYWQIVAPSTPMRAKPFINMMIQEKIPLSARQKQTLEWAEFESRPGDMVFVPRFWYHYVLSLDDWNANVNVVFSPTWTAEESAVAIRERERILAIGALERTPARRLFGPRISLSVSSYGGDGEAFYDVSRARAGRAGALRGIMRELGSAPIAALMALNKRLLGLED